MREPPLDPDAAVTRRAALKLAGASAAAAVGLAGCAETAEYPLHHPVELTFDGPSSGERADPNPFLDYRLRVTFSGPDARRFTRPGFFAGDGRGGPEGETWRVRFTPTATGDWEYSVTFERGPAVATRPDAAGSSVEPPDGETGSFHVSASEATGRDFRAPDRGVVRNGGGHYLTFSGSGDPFVRAGMNVPENFLAYDGFDGQRDGSKDYAAHEVHWTEGDPDWGDGRGRGIVGAVNYLAERGANSQYLLPMNVGGDGDDVWPHPSKNGEETRYDVSKLRRWNVVFEHMQARGVMLHVVLSEQETGNETYYDDGDLGTARKLFYRELVARFGHHPALQWNVGEENNYGTALRSRMADYLNRLQAYDHPVVTHNGDLDEMFAPLLGDEDFDMTSFQMGGPTAEVTATIREYRARSARYGHPWVISLDEPHTIEHDPDGDGSDTAGGHPFGRTERMWPAFLHGAGGFEWYLHRRGLGPDEHGLDWEFQDYTQVEDVLAWCAHAVAFVERLPLDRMDPTPGVATTGHALADPGSEYAVYCPEGPSGVTVDLPVGDWTVEYYDPTDGAWDDPQPVGGGRDASLPSSSFDGDAAARITPA